MVDARQTQALRSNPFQDPSLRINDVPHWVQVDRLPQALRMERILDELERVLNGQAPIIDAPAAFKDSLLPQRLHVK
jgi:hypothetical protein